MNCRFCDTERQQHIISKNNHAFALLSNPRLIRGHTLVIPWRHIEYPGELYYEELADCFSLIEDLRAKMLKSKLAEGVDIRQHYRPFLSESHVKVNHLHFHVIPRNPEDRLHKHSMRFETDIFTNLSDKEKQEVSTLLSSDSHY